ncbi:uncharacterized protein MICPUCDRAFT_10649, partial [Micromonas pusilla CCMP1545]
WRGRDLAADPSRWTHVLTSDEIAELDDALRRARAGGVDVIDLTPETFPLPTLAPRLRRMRDDLVHGLGVYLIRGLPVERYDRWETCAAFYGMGTHMGWACPQNAAGHVLGHDLGRDPNDPATRTYTTSAAQPFHTDSADVVGLCCLNNDVVGGDSMVASVVEIWNRMRSESPAALRTLAEPFPVDRKGEIPPGCGPTYDMPVFHVHRGDGSGSEPAEPTLMNAGPEWLLSGIYDRNFIASAQARFDVENDGVPRLTSAQTEALDALDAMCLDDDVCLHMRLEPGDIQWLHNHTTLHARTAYGVDPGGRDAGEPPPRHLLRLWITPPNARPLPASFATRFGSVTVGPERGGIRVEGQTPYCALE